jgi:membrane protein implicated in regulation of membrane protease activity
MPRLALYALTVCALAVAAAVVSFVQGYWIGVIWVLLAGLSSNMAWYYLRRAKTERERNARTATG